MPEDLLMLQILFPMLLSLVSAFVSSRKISKFLVLLGGLFGLSSAVFLISHMSFDDLAVIKYQVGGWSSAIGIELAFDGLAGIFLILINFAFLFAGLFNLYDSEIKAPKSPLFNMLLLICFTGMNGIVLSNDIFNIYVFLEIFSLASYALVGVNGDAKSLKAAINYLIIGTLAASFYLIGVGLLYAAFGTLNIEILAFKFQHAQPSVVVLAGYSMIIIFFAMKAAIFPMHSWLVEAYTRASKTVVVFFSAVSTKVVIYIFLRLVSKIFGCDFVLEHDVVLSLLLALFVIQLLAGGLLAFAADSDRKLLAYSSISQIGYIMFAIFTGLEHSIDAAFIMIFSHALAKGNLFLILFGNGTMSGLCKKSTLLSFAMLVSILNLGGFPLTLGFAGKWLLLGNLIANANYVLLATFIIATAVTSLYVWKLIEKAFFAPASTECHDTACHPMLQFASGVVALLLLVAGVFPENLLFMFARVGGFCYNPWL